MNPFEYSDEDYPFEPDTRSEAKKWLDAEMDKRWANEQGAEQYPILEAIALEVIEENRRLREQIGQGVPDVGQFINLLVSAAFRKGELWERCQGKGWPEAESDEFTKLRDETIPDAIAQLQRALASAPQAPQGEQHPDDAAVDRFAVAMKDKLATARQKGRGGWETCSAEDLGRMLREHVEKGDPRDVANFCMFLWSLGHGIAPQASVVQQEPSQAASDAYDRIDHFLRQKLDDHDYAHYSFDLDLVWGAAPAPQQKPLTDEQDRALCEAYCNAASDEYFKARPQLDSSANRRIFCAGHRKAWIEWQAAHGIGEKK